MELTAWGITNATVEPIAGGYNSLAWHVFAGERRYVAKRVGGDRAAFEWGLGIADRLEERGFRAGGPVRTLTGAWTVPSEGEWLALLRFVPGTPVPLDTPEGLETWGRAMGRAHTLLHDAAPSAAPEERAPVDAFDRAVPSTRFPFADRFAIQ